MPTLPRSSVTAIPLVSACFHPQPAFFTVFLTFPNNYLKISGFIYLVACSRCGCVRRVQCVQGPTEAQRPLDPLELGLQIVVNNPVQMLGTEFRSPAPGTILFSQLIMKTYECYLLNCLIILPSQGYFTEYPHLRGCIDSEDATPDKCNRPVLIHVVSLSFCIMSQSIRAQSTEVLFGCSSPHTLTPPPPPRFAEWTKRGCTLNVSFSATLHEFLLAMFSLHLFTEQPQKICSPSFLCNLDQACLVYLSVE